MKPSSLERALDAMESIMPGEPYALRPGDPKRKLIHELARISRELKIRPVVIGGLAVNHHGYLRVTVDVDLLLSRDHATKLRYRLMDERGWKRSKEGFRNLDLKTDLHVHMKNEPSPATMRVTDHIPVPALEDLLAIKAETNLAKDDADIGSLLKLRPSRINSLHATTRKRLRTQQSRLHFDRVVARAKEELALGR